MGVKIVPRYGNTFKEKTYLSAIFGGLKTTIKNFTTNVGDLSQLPTLCYPEDRPQDITPRYRGVHRLTHRADDSIACVACFMCATACPAQCIFIEAVEREDGVDEKMPKRFDIDLLECIFCGYCVEACPCDAIRMDSGIFSIIGEKREDFVYDKEKLLSIPAAEKEGATSRAK
jgi:NADH-quinone oxidoreductase subunit I